jgi:AcrR family transcriptional regulator
MGLVEMPVSKASPRERQVGGTLGAHRRAEVLDKAVAVFEEKGFAATTLRDIADALAVSRPTLYYYFSSKEEILDELVRNLSMDAVTTVPVLASADAKGYRDALRAAVRSVYVYVAERPKLFRMLTTSETQLPKGSAQRFLMAKADFISRLVLLIDGGIAAGAFRVVNVQVAALGIMSMATMLALTYPDTLGVNDASGADLIADMAVRSLECDTDYPARQPSEVLDRIRKDLDAVQHMIEQRSRPLL